MSTLNWNDYNAEGTAVAELRSEPPVVTIGRVVEETMVSREALKLGLTLVTGFGLLGMAIGGYLLRV